MDVKQYRWNPHTDAMLSVVVAGGVRVHMIERPWIDDGTPGGKSYESCVPAGKYKLVPFKRPNGDQVYQLINEDLGVYALEADVPGDTRDEKKQNGRWLILWHRANEASEVNGCGAPGVGQYWDEGTPKVGPSRVAMQRLRNVLGEEEHTLEIIDL